MGNVQVPTDRPKEALAMLNYFLNNDLHWTSSFDSGGQGREDASGAGGGSSGKYSMLISGTPIEDRYSCNPAHHSSTRCVTVHAGEVMSVVSLHGGAGSGVDGIGSDADGDGIAAAPEYTWYLNGGLLPRVTGASELPLSESGDYRVALAFVDGNTLSLPTVTISISAEDSGGRMVQGTVPAWSLAPTTIFSIAFGALLARCMGGGGGGDGVGGGGGSGSNDDNDDVPMIRMN